MSVARRFFGLILFALSVWIAWQIIPAIRFIAVQTGALGEVIQDPVFLLPLTATALGALGGLVAVFRLPGGGLLGTIGALVYILFGIATLMAGGDQSMWLPKLVFGSQLLVLALAVLRLPRKTA